MPQQQHAQLPSNEARIQLAKLAIKNNQFQSARAAAKSFKTCPRTLSRRLNGMPSRNDCPPNSKNLTILEEQTLIEHAIDVDNRGFQLNYDLLRVLANKLLADRGAPPVGKNWPLNFVQRVNTLKIRVNRKYDYQRALNENPDIIQAWFRLVRNTVAKYGIQDDDVYNFDEAGFQMGVITTRLVITGTERRQSPKSIQPGNTEWVTSIVAANAAGWAPPPFLIFKGAQHYDTWYQAIKNRHDWVLSVSEKG